MANLLPSSVTDGQRSHDDTDNDVSDAAIEFERNSAASPLSIKAHRPLLFHKIHNQTSILALLISDSKIYAGTQSGDLLVCYHCAYLKLFNRAKCVQVWSLETFELLSSIHAHKSSVLCLNLSADGTLLFTGAGDAIVNVRDTPSCIGPQLRDDRSGPRALSAVCTRYIPNTTSVMFSALPTHQTCRPSI